VETLKVWTLSKLSKRFHRGNARGMDIIKIVKKVSSWKRQRYGYCQNFALSFQGTFYWESFNVFILPENKLDGTFVIITVIRIFLTPIKHCIYGSFNVQFTNNCNMRTLRDECNGDSMAECRLPVIECIER
jgi:hypothetical protein